MTTGTQVAVVPANFQLPAHLLTAEAAAAIAAYNAAAAGGIKLGGFPRISIKGSKFHIVKGGETKTIMAPAQPGQPALPMMILEAVIVSANPQLSKTYYEGDYQPGDDKEPTCSAINGIVPDAHIKVPQHTNCAACPQNVWGSKISKQSGKEIKACTDNKVLALVPAADLNYEALGFNVTPSALGDWGKFVKALSERNIPVNAIVTNITFDATAAHPKTVFSFNRVLSAEEYAKVLERAQGDDVKNIVSPVRSVTVPNLPAPAAAAPAPVPAPAPTPPPPVIPITPAAPPPATTGFGAAGTSPAAPQTVQAPPPPAPEKQKRAPRKAAAPADDGLAHLPEHIRTTVLALGVEDPTAQALMAKYPKPEAAQTPATPAAPVTPVTPTGGFGAAGAVAAPAAVTTAPGSTLKEQLQARLTAAAGKTQAAG